MRMVVKRPYTWRNRSGIEGSQICIGLIDKQSKLQEFVRVLTDYIFKALIFTVIILDEFQNKWLGLKLISLIKNHPDISVSRSQKVTLFRWVLISYDLLAHDIWWIDRGIYTYIYRFVPGSNFAGITITALLYCSDCSAGADCRSNGRLE